MTYITTFHPFVCQMRIHQDALLPSSLMKTVVDSVVQLYLSALHPYTPNVSVEEAGMVTFPDAPR